ncbi:hypothetical protein CVT26_012564 [Gymnopilus dilepis]|uniref:Secreted protein n=1 Tax=Gymnopilus dilepis TaxID=231916 RepID=A0A409YPW1_9AGAR|nr:hypothetical protein CVT26_012564 [Gymnopilus dilepis]
MNAVLISLFVRASSASSTSNSSRQLHVGAYTYAAHNASPHASLTTIHTRLPMTWTPNVVAAPQCPSYTFQLPPIHPRLKKFALLQIPDA